MSLHQCADKRLIDAWQQERDELAFTILDNRYRPQLTAYVGDRLDGYLKNFDDEIVQDVFEALRTTKQDFPDNRSIGPWLVTVADRRIADFHRRHHAKKRGVGRTVEFSTLVKGLDRVGNEYAAEEQGYTMRDRVPYEAAHDETPEKLACRSEQESIARKMFGRLPGRQCEVMHLYGIQGLSIDETAEALGIDRESVKTHIRRAREKLMGMHELHQLTGDSAEEQSHKGESTRAAGRALLRNLPKIIIIMYAIGGETADAINLDVLSGVCTVETDIDEVRRDDEDGHHDSDKQRRKSLMRLPLRPVAAVACRPLLDQEHPSVRARLAERREASTLLSDFSLSGNEDDRILSFRVAQTARVPSRMPRGTILEAA